MYILFVVFNVSFHVNVEERKAAVICGRKHFLNVYVHSFSLVFI